MKKPILYSYYRSSASYRVRIALNLKNIQYDYQPVHLLNKGGEQKSSEYLKLNPMGEVPCLVINQVPLSQSMAILMFLDSHQPKPPLFPIDSILRAQVIQFCENINAGIHPVQNLKVLQKLEADFNATQDQKLAWSAHWIEKGFESLEKLLIKTAGKYCFGDEVTAADCFLVPQVYNAKRFKLNLSRFPKIESIEKECLKLDAFSKAEPGKQPDTPPEYK